jgi:acetyltransferase
MVKVEGYELILGSTVDPQFGPVVLFGSGGQLVEVYRDRGLALPPLNTTLAQRLMERTKVYRALAGGRGRKPVDLQALENVLVRFSYIPVELPRIKEIDINPLLVSPDGLIALDARILLFDASVPDADLPSPAIRPYPSQYVTHWKAKNGTELVIRPIRPEDEPRMARFHESLSAQSVYLRYFHMESLDSRVAHDRLMAKCFLDYDREMALVAESPGGALGSAADGAANADDRAEILGVGRMTRDRNRTQAEIAVVVSDRAQHQGIGTELLGRLIDVARHEKIERLVATTLPENDSMIGLARHFGFVVEASTNISQVTAVLKL